MASHERHIVQGVEVLEAGGTEPGTYKVTVIRPGFNKSKQRFYPAEVLRRDGHVFKGAKMFANHQTEAEQRARPEGNVNDWVATLTDVKAESDGTLTGEVRVHDPAFDAKLQGLKKAGLLGQMGVSIRAIGEGEKRVHEGVDTLVMESILKSRSVDFVTYAGAGGQVQESDTFDVAGEDAASVEEAARKAQAESYVALGMSEREAEAASRIKGEGR